MPNENNPSKRSRALHRLSARQVETTAKPGAYMDGGGLLLRVSEAGGKKWLFRYTSPLTAVRREMGLGRADRGYVSLKDAREAAQAARDLVARNLDPIEEAARATEAHRAEANKAPPKTFGEFSDEWLAQKEQSFANPKHRAQWRMTLLRYAAPLRSKAPAAISTEDVLRVLQPIWQSKPETAKRFQGRIESVMDAARAKRYYAGQNPARWRGHLDKLLPGRSKREKGHHAAMPYKQLPSFVADLRLRAGIAARALEFLILAAARSGEVRGMTWAEIDLDGRRWTVPASRMKAGKEHRVPLCERSLVILREMARLRPVDDEGRALVFPGAKDGAPMSDMTLAAVLKRMGLGEFTVHGFRSCFRDWAEDVARFPYGAIKAALAHTISDSTDAAYRRGDGYDIRAELMNVWEGYVGGGASSAKVIPLRKA